MTLAEPLKIRVSTLTPIWTGDSDQKTSYLRATSFLGGMRFWTEALLRSFGENVCNITHQENRCIHDSQNGQWGCAACNIFGCTGLSRSFRLRVIDDDGLKEIKSKKVTIEQQTYNSNGQTRMSLYFPKGGLTGSFAITIMPIRPGDLNPYFLAGFKLLLEWGNLGAQDQYGQGLVKADTESMQEKLQSIDLEEQPQTNDNNELPNFKDFFFFKGKVTDTSTEVNKVPFMVRNKVRNSLREGKNQTSLRHYFCGCLGSGNQEKQGAKYNISLYDNQLYGWGWFPRQGNYKAFRDSCLNILKQRLEDVCSNSLIWKEYNSVRDEASHHSWPEYVRDMLNNAWR